MKKRPLIVLTGPTAVGKTGLSIELAKRVNGEIISADSMQVYKKMDIGTAKIKPEQMQGVKHYLIDEYEPDADFSVAVFQKDAKKYMDMIYESGKIPILVGGTGFYIQAVLNDIEFTEEENQSTYRAQLEEMAKTKGSQLLHDMLHEVDVEAAKQIHPNNVKRVVRALEYFKINKEPISKHNQEQRQKDSPYEFCYFVINDQRDRLYKRIDTRVDDMINDGLVLEVDNLLKQGYGRNLVSMQGLGYKEIAAYLAGEITLEEAATILKRDTRHFAKRQLTWFRREKEVIWVNRPDHGDSDEKMLEFILGHCVKISWK